MSKPSMEGLNAYGRGGQCAADAAAVQTIADNWNEWRKFLGGMGSRIMKTVSELESVNKFIDKFNVSDDWKLCIMVVVAIVPVAFELATNKEWQASLKHVSRQTRDVAQGYAHKVAEGIRERAKSTTAGARPLLCHIQLTVKSAYESARIVVARMTARTIVTVRQTYAGVRSMVGILFGR